MIFKPKALSMAMVAICSAGSVVAGGADVTLMPTEMMFEKGGYAEMSVAKVSPNVTGKTMAPTVSMYSEYTATTVGIKTDMNEKISLGFANYLSAAIQVDYRQTGSPVKAAFVDLNIKSNVLLAKYQINDNLSALAAVKHSITSNATANVLTNPNGNLIIPSANDTSFAALVAYEKPEIALRISALYQSETKFKLPMTSSTYPGGVADGKAGLPSSITLRFQSGIAPDTLLFGSIHRGNWAKSQIEFETDASLAAGKNTLAARSSFTTTSAYNLGIGRKLSDTYAISASYGWEKGAGYDGTSLLSTTDGKKTLSLGGKYTNGAMTFSVGYSRIKFGDYRYEVDTYANNAVFSDNKANAIGVKIGISF
jgi:long-subunit fatty acid transport protein